MTEVLQQEDLSEYMPPYDDDVEQVELKEANVLERVGSLPLVANTWEVVSSYYASAKKTYPSVTPILEMAEKLTTGAAHVALTTSKPVISRFGPTVNTYANRGLDKLEDALPIIRDQPDEIYDSTRAAVTSLVSSKIDTALTATEKYVDYYLPPAEKEEDDDDSDSDEEDSDDDSDDSSCMDDAEPASPKDRIRVISNKVRERAYHRAMDKVHGVQKRSGETLKRLKFTVDLIQYAKENIDATTGRVVSRVTSAGENLRHGVAVSQENVANVWKEIKTRSSETAAELHVLERARALTGQLQKSCSTVLGIVTELPQYEYLRTQATKAKESADNLARNIAEITSINELSSTLATSARHQLENVGHLLGNLFEALSDHAPLSWLAPDLDYDPLEGLGMQDLEADLRLHDDNPADGLPVREGSRDNHVRSRRG